MDILQIKKERSLYKMRRINKLRKYWRREFSIIVLVIVVTLALGIIAVELIDNTKTFENICIKENGSFYELQNTTCAVGYLNCALVCYLDNEVIDYYERKELYKKESRETAK
jgi:hypothetical protein